MTPDPTLIEQELIAKFREIALAGDFSPDDLGGDIGTMNLRNPDGFALVEIVEQLATLQGSATLPSEAITDAMLWAGREQASKYCVRVEDFMLRHIYTAMRATTPTAPGQDTGASVPDQALAVPVEPVARLDPSGFDPSRCVLTYALALIAEECAEATQFIGKALRFGFDTPGAPETPFNGDTARTNLPKELGDIRAAIRFAAAHGFVDEAAVKEAEDRKFAKLLNPASRDNLGRQLAPLPAIATEAQRAETVEQGSVHEGAGPEDIAHD